MSRFLLLLTAFLMFGTLHCQNIKPGWYISVNSDDSLFININDSMLQFGAITNNDTIKYPVFYKTTHINGNFYQIEAKYTSSASYYNVACAHIPLSVAPWIDSCSVNFQLDITSPYIIDSFFHDMKYNDTIPIVNSRTWHLKGSRSYGSFFQIKLLEPYCHGIDGRSFSPVNLSLYLKEGWFKPRNNYYIRSGNLNNMSISAIVVKRDFIFNKADIIKWQGFEFRRIEIDQF